MGRVADVMREADFWAAETTGKTVTGVNVQQAIDAHDRRADSLRERSHEQIARGTLLIDTKGEKVGQINGLSVLSLGTFSFGRPSRITARVRMGRGQVVDIEREVELGGPLHSKGVLILSGYLSSRYALDRPLSLSASLVFEQSYGGVDGDSTSSAELYALLSALAEAPIRQGLAVTGSVNQQGEVQAIGGVNEKIEGFFDVCSERRLDGKQGVLIPETNIKHLMLRQDVVDACGARRFHIFPVRTIDEGIELLTGMPAGTRGAKGEFRANTVNRLVEGQAPQACRRLARLQPARFGEFMMATPDQADTASQAAYDVNVHRILIVLDATEDSLASLDLATRLAAKLHADIEGLFVEDINLLRMADLPCTRVVSVAATSNKGLSLAFDGAGTASSGPRRTGRSGLYGGTVFGSVVVPYRSRLGGQ